jgi:methylphosphotriester-DNA--protein-cysteine methyltransferase
VAQPRVEFSWEKLDALLQFKATLKFCAEYLEVSVDTVQRRIKEEKGITFEEYAALKLQRTAVKLQQKAIEMALGGNTVMMIFALKNFAGWSDKIETKLDTSTIQINIDNVDTGL